MVRNAIRYVPWKDRRAVVRDMKKIYRAPTVEAAEEALEAFAEAWGEKYPMAVKTWQERWELVIPQFSYPEPIRKAIYTTNAIESLNSSLRRVLRKRGAFPTDDSVRKVLYLAIRQQSKKWTMPIRDWPAALNYFSIVFEGRLPE